MKPLKTSTRTNYKKLVKKYVFYKSYLNGVLANNDKLGCWYVFELYLYLVENCKYLESHIPTSYLKDLSFIDFKEATSAHMDLLIKQQIDFNNSDEFKEYKNLVDTLKNGKKNDNY